MSGERLPPSWLECRLEDVVEYGTTIKVEPEQIPDDAWVLELEDVERDTSKILQRTTFRERQSKSTKNQFSRGDVLYGKLRPYLNKVLYAPEDGYCTTEIIPLSPSPSCLDARYLLHWLKHPRFLEYVSSVSHGLNMPRLGTEAGRAAPFVLAPLSEQKRIAEKLDALLSRVDACRDRLDCIPGILKRFRQSVLAAAQRGELTREWRAGRSMSDSSQTISFDDDALEVPRCWSDAALRELLDVRRPLCYGVVQPGEPVLGGTSLIRVQDMSRGTIAQDQLRTISSAMDTEYKRSRVNEGDVLISVVGTIGRVAVVPPGFQGNIARAIARLACGDRVLPGWIRYWLESDVVQWWLLRTSREVARKTLNLADLATLRLAVPSLEEQAEIVRRVDELLGIADQLELRLEAAHRRMAQMIPSALQKAFRGDLVPQDPSDEPASELLARLRAARADVAPTRRRRTPARA